MQATAERLGVMHLLDKRFAGVAKGVGSGKILGRIHQVHSDTSLNKTCGLPFSLHQCDSAIRSCVDSPWAVLRTADFHIGSEVASQALRPSCRHS